MEEAPILCFNVTVMEKFHYARFSYYSEVQNNHYDFIATVTLVKFLEGMKLRYIANNS